MRSRLDLLVERELDAVFFPRQRDRTMSGVKCYTDSNVDASMAELDECVNHTGLFVDGLKVMLLKMAGLFFIPSQCGVNFP